MTRFQLERISNNLATSFGLLICLVLTACCNDCEPPPQPGSTVSLAGNAVKGYLSGATVNFYVLNPNGSKGSTLGTATTNAKGNFTVSLTPAPTGAFLAETSGGSYIDEVTAATVTLGGSDQLCAVLPAGTTQATITPLTDMACVRARALAAAGVLLDEAVASSNIGVAQQFNVTDIIGTLPIAANNSADVATAVRDERIYGIVLAGIAQEAATLGVRAVDLAAALAEDLSDGSLNGSKNGAPIVVPNSAFTLSASAGTNGLQSALNTFIASANNQTHLTAATVSSVPLPVGINTAGKLYTTTTVLPAWISGQSGSVTLTAKGGTPPYRCSLKAGTLPVGLSLSASCVLSGTVPLLSAGTTMSISAPFTVTITDSATPSASVDQELRVTTVAPRPTLVPVAGVMTVNVSGTTLVAAANGGTPPFHFAHDSFAYGAHPLGTVVDLSGNLTGTPTQTGVFNFRVCVIDLVGAKDCQMTSVTVNPAVSGLTLAVTKAGTGSGTVTSSPTGISCGATCSASFASGASVTLTATPSTGSTFAGWSGACTGTGSCVVTMTINKTVTATFDLSPGGPQPVASLTYTSVSCTFIGSEIGPPTLTYTATVSGPVGSSIYDHSSIGAGGQGSPTTCGTWTFNSIGLSCERLSGNPASTSVTIQNRPFQGGLITIDTQMFVPSNGLLDFKTTVTCPAPR